MTPKAVDEKDKTKDKDMLLDNDVELLKKEMRIKQQQLANFMEKARIVLEANENRGLEEAVHVEEMEQDMREKFLVTLISYQTEKERLHLIMIVWWLVTILLGILSMVIHEFITDYGMYGAWVGLLLSNALLIIIYRLSDRRKFNRIVINFRNNHVESLRKKHRESSDGAMYANRNAVEVLIEDESCDA